MRMPPQLAERARAIVYGGQWTPPPARPASTLALLRDTGAGIEVALLQRATTLAFAKDMYVFPGGALDDTDADFGDPWLVAAIRETFEESGVLLSVPAAPADGWRLRDLPFPEVLSELGVSPDLAALHSFAHWVTPEVESRRFDTRFYAAALPVDQDLADYTSEHQNIGWYRPAAASELPMLPPTAAVLAELAGFDTVAEALAVRRDPVPLMPHPVATGDGDVTWLLVDARTGDPV
jgi:8-oxo-dGTP pyrophosphatase MutT (NUDIX family)